MFNVPMLYSIVLQITSQKDIAFINTRVKCNAVCASSVPFVLCISRKYQSSVYSMQRIGY